MKSRSESEYRLRIAERFAAEAESAFRRDEWRWCVDSSRESVENAAKAVIAYFEPVEKTHNPDKQLADLLERALVDKVLENDIKDLVRLSEPMGLKMHIRIRYGDEEAFIDPWQLFQKEAASESLEVARKSLAIARKVYEFYTK